jgi:hypothetical protein
MPSFEHDSSSSSSSSSDSNSRSGGETAEQPWQTVKRRRGNRSSGPLDGEQAKASRAGKAALAHNVELNRQCSEQTWERLERRGMPGPSGDSTSAVSSAALFKGLVRRGPRRVG